MAIGRSPSRMRPNLSLPSLFRGAAIVSVETPRALSLPMMSSTVILTLAELQNFVKVVDDCLTNDDTFQAQLTHVRAALKCAHANGIAFSKKKFLFGQQEVPFCGYRVSDSGWILDSDKTSAITDFLLPCNRTDLWSFFGLVNQCSAYTTTLSELCGPLRPLLKTLTNFCVIAVTPLPSTA